MSSRLSKLPPEQYDEVLAEARAILGSSAMKLVFEELQDEYLQGLIQAEVGGLTASTLHASIRVLADVQGKLKSYTTDGLIKAKRAR